MPTCGGKRRAEQIWDRKITITAPRLRGNHDSLGVSMKKETEIYKEMAALDAQIQEMIKQSPDLAGVHEAVFDGEAPGDVVYLDRMPTAEEWARAIELARKE